MEKLTLGGMTPTASFSRVTYFPTKPNFEWFDGSIFFRNDCLRVQIQAEITLHLNGYSIDDLTSMIDVIPQHKTIKIVATRENNSAASTLCQPLCKLNVFLIL